ncbi:AI-2E family transporter [Nocardia puris]|uniref:AI-2E family transporter n=1 Tax=Nocardia puris TaxID=208602 RepID=UPI001894A358|nr:AI-2E family transporter [Nocardia puris]MBF6214656.1 AI-2E family transporter [Nocardia puris]MBF6368870.1 AI-2E family transporter [Nocardia puris]MBF6462450.1 AI-2E family transporter [Nocardia puris]
MSEREEPTSGAIGKDTAPDRGAVIGTGLFWLAKWSLCVVAIAAGAWVLGWVVAKLWVVVLPVALAIVVATVLWPPTRWLMKQGLKPALAATLTLLGFFAIVSGVIALIVPSVVDQAPQLADKGTAGVNQVRDWLQGPPLNIRDEQLDSAVEAIVSRLQSSAETIATGVFTGVTTATSALVTLFLVLVLSFFFIKDGPRFLPWLHNVTGSKGGRHFEAVLSRIWDTLGGFIRTQALVSLIDAVLIGAGLVILGVPLAMVLAVLTFIGGFIPIVGAFVAGALAVLVALVGNGLTTALIVLGIIIAVQQFEGNVLQPILQSRSMQLHAVVVLLAVTAGGALFGIVGAFLAVPVAAIVAVVLRYVGEQIDTATAPPPEVTDEPEPEPAT